MKKLLITGILLTVATMILWSQVPQAMTYKAIAKDDWGVALPNKSITLRLTIIHGSENGLEVYRETHNTTTNKFGLMDVEIGNGTADIGSFDGIDWSTGVYYIKIEMDPKGGTDFRLEDPAHQLLSVPYALYAGNADNVANESDPVFISYPAYGITNGNITNWNDAFSWGNHAGLYRPITYVPAWSEITNSPFIITTPSNGQLLKYDGTNWINFTPDYLTSFTELDPVFTVNFDFTGSATNDLLQFNGTKWVKFTPNFALTNHTHSDATTTISGFMSSTDKTKLDGLDGSETKVTAGTNVTVTGTGTTATPYVVNAASGGSVPTHTIGESYGGGIVFWVDATGQHGLIAATADQSTGIQWYNGTYTTTNAVRGGIGAGMYNTERIIANQGVGSYAAQLCANYQGGGYGDWYLPSKYELNLLYQQKTAVGGFATTYYWSSTENDGGSAWLQRISTGLQGANVKNYPGSVRAIRAF